MLEVDGDAGEPHAFVEERVRDDPELRAHNLSARPGRWRGIWPVRWRWGWAVPLRIPIEGENLRQLRRLAVKFAEPEIAICIAVRHRDGTLLISAPDIGDDNTWVTSNRVTRSTLEAMRKTLGSSLPLR